MARSRRVHWNEVYGKKSPEDLTWAQPWPETSLALIRNTGLGPESRIIDVGGGTSPLAAVLLEEGFRNVSVLDISDRALDLARARLGARAAEVEWYGTDITCFAPSHRWDLWHDRAAFHFLTEEEDRKAYLRVMGNGLEPGGHVLISTFALDGPARCSGLDVIRYSPDTLQAQLGDGFDLRGSVGELHRTPTGGAQEFMYSWFQKAL